MLAWLKICLYLCFIYMSLAQSIEEQVEEEDKGLHDLQILLDTISPVPDGPPPNSLVNELTADTFFASIGNGQKTKNQKWIVLFYAPWCARSKEAIRTLGHLSPFLTERGVTIGAIDASKYEEVADRLFIFSFPVLKMFSNGMIYPLDKSPTKPSIMEFVIRDWQKQPPLEFYLGSSHLLNLNEDEFDVLSAASVSPTTRTTKWLVMFYAPWCLVSQAFLPYFDALANRLSSKEDIKVAIFDGSKYAGQSDRFGVEGFPEILLIREGQYVRFNGMRSLDALMQFVITGFDSPHVLANPPPLPWIQVAEEKLRLLVDTLKSDVEDMWKFKKAASVVIFLTGMIFCGIQRACCLGVRVCSRKLPLKPKHLGASKLKQHEN